MVAHTYLFGVFCCVLHLLNMRGRFNTLKIPYGKCSPFVRCPRFSPSNNGSYFSACAVISSTQRAVYVGISYIFLTRLHDYFFRMVAHLYLFGVRCCGLHLLNMRGRYNTLKISYGKSTRLSGARVPFLQMRARHVLA